MPVQAMLDIEGLKWINDNVGWPAGDELLRVVAAAIGDEGVTGYRLGGDEFAFEGKDEAAVATTIERIRGRLREASIDAIGRDGSPRRLRGPRVHAGIGRSLEEVASALRGAKQAGVVSGERAARGTRPLGLTEVSPARGFDRDQDPGLRARVARAFRSVARFLGRVDEPTYRFYLRALREAEPAFGKKAPPSEGWMSLEWLVRDARRSGSGA